MTDDDFDGYALRPLADEGEDAARDRLARGAAARRDPREPQRLSDAAGPDAGTDVQRLLADGRLS